MKSLLGESGTTVLTTFRELRSMVGSGVCGPSTAAMWLA